MSLYNKAAYSFMNMDEQRLQELIKKYLSGNCTAQERLEVERMYNSISEPRKEAMDEDLLHLASEESWDRFQQHIQSTRHKPRQKLFAYATAAAVVLMLAIGYQFMAPKKLLTLPPDNAKTIQDVSPGGNYATLTLANGQHINLNQAPKGTVTNSFFINIQKTNDGEVVFTPSDSSNPASTAANKISTPKGGQFIVTLPDGSKVWLNAATSLTFPTSFTGKTNRTVSLEGEAYFEITKNQQQPFVVKTATQQVKVLGTHFNINSYPDEPAVRTTLLEGSVRIFSTQLNISETLRHNQVAVTLRPNEMAVHQSDKIKIEQADENTIAWTQGKMKFKNAELPSILKEVSRWYNLTIRYEGTIPSNHFTASISRDSKLSEVLLILEGIGVQFKIEKQSGENVLVVKSLHN